MLDSVSVEYQKTLICDNKIFRVRSHCTIHSLHAAGDIFSKINLICLLSAPQ
jgi:hypothetical protein